MMINPIRGEAHSSGSNPIEPTKGLSKEEIRDSKEGTMRMQLNTLASSTRKFQGSKEAPTLGALQNDLPGLVKFMNSRLPNM